jgi:outer membrane immunogenic protein
MGTRILSTNTLPLRATLLALLAAVISAPLASVARSQTGAVAPRTPDPELAVDYNYVRSNAPPDGCTCFSLNGGSAAFAWPIKPMSSGHFALVGDVSVTHADSITSANYSLTLSTFTAGVRYVPRFGHSPLQPFVQTLAGLAHSSGSLVEGGTAAVSNSGAAFAANLGGGLDLRINRRFSLRVVEADYLLTLFVNGTNDHQNNMRLGAGLVFHF